MTGCVPIRLIYVNSENNIIKVKCDVLITLNKHCISRGELIALLKANKDDNGSRYSILYILQYSGGLIPIKKIDTILFDEAKCDDVDELSLVFYESKNPNGTRRVYMTPKKTHKKRYV